MMLTWNSVPENHCRDREQGHSEGDQSSHSTQHSFLASCSAPRGHRFVAVPALHFFLKCFALRDCLAPRFLVDGKKIGFGVWCWPLLRVLRSDSMPIARHMTNIVQASHAAVNTSVMLNKSSMRGQASGGTDSIALRTGSTASSISNLQNNGLQSKRRRQTESWVKKNFGKGEDDLISLSALVFFG